MSILSPQGRRRLDKFKSLKRGYYSFVIMCSLIILSLAAELLVNSRPIIVQYENQIYFPTYGDILPGTTFGHDYQWETDYRQLKKDFTKTGASNWLVMPIIPFNPFENNFIEGEYPPYAPSLTHKHYLGTDMAGRDILSRLIYGFRIAILFSLFLLVVTLSLIHI